MLDTFTNNTAFCMFVRHRPSHGRSDLADHEKVNASLSDSRISYSIVIDHRNWQPDCAVISTAVMSGCIGHWDAGDRAGCSKQCCQLL